MLLFLAFTIPCLTPSEPSMFKTCILPKGLSLAQLLIYCMYAEPVRSAVAAGFYRIPMYFILFHNFHPLLHTITNRTFVLHHFMLPYSRFPLRYISHFYAHTISSTKDQKKRSLRKNFIYVTYIQFNIQHNSTLPFFPSEGSENMWAT